MEITQDNHLAIFLGQHTQKMSDTSHTVYCEVLYRMYTTWCETHQVQPQSQTRFGRMIPCKKVILPLPGTNGLAVRVFSGLALRSSASVASLWQHELSKYTFERIHGVKEGQTIQIELIHDMEVNELTLPMFTTS